MRSIRRPLAFFLLPWLLALFDGWMAFSATDSTCEPPPQAVEEPLPTSGCELDPFG